MYLLCSSECIRGQYLAVGSNDDDGGGGHLFCDLKKTYCYLCSTGDTRRRSRDLLEFSQTP